MSDTGNKLVNAIKDKGKNLEAEMSFFDHLEALRWHLIRASVAILVFTILAFSYFDTLWQGIIMAPSKNDFWTARKMCELGHWLHRDMCFNTIKVQLMNNEMAGQFILQINTSLLAGITLGIPYLLWEIWRFVKPALHEKERKAASGFVFYATFLFFLGVMFGYYVITPISVHFLMGYTVSPDILNLPDIDSYLSSVATLTLATGLVFELPILIYILANLGIMTPKFMRASRRYAIVVILIIAAVVTPTPDMLTMTVVSIPLFILYEVSIFVAVAVEKRKIKKSEELMRS
ncbi:twin-arginine translocase subunit TatC [Mucilaginibacter mali]|uniref:Sec-independent protein translocase protein TatC n=1 Tax=Mucilaginibacter mali TaxID=2740462 RepID=A0A7D4UP53_9SPHI|nr:twin-arginine translocase subunit TatC [Mucilaginibacter mali]QKJ32681.1 twin-arginine translocase subunit TatC [Mucilaginibacter mali]